ncbi:unnamed protein product [Symbiodinium sp. KB8]|nr:unnamed protein product [Symbiodinium sp. KB8]
MTCCVMPAVAVMLPGLMPHDCFSPTGSPTDSEDSDRIQIAGSCQSTTAKREWRLEGSPTFGTAETVPGLSSLLSSVGLSSYETAAEAWCHQMGAAHLTELAEEDNLKSFGEALGSKGQVVTGIYLPLKHMSGWGGWSYVPGAIEESCIGCRRLDASTWLLFSVASFQSVSAEAIGFGPCSFAWKSAVPIVLGLQHYSAQARPSPAAFGRGCPDPDLARSAFGVGAEPATPALIVVPGRAVVDTGAPAGSLPEALVAEGAATFIHGYGATRGPWFCNSGPLSSASGFLVVVKPPLVEKEAFKMAAGGERGCSLARDPELQEQLRQLWKNWLEAQEQLKWPMENAPAWVPNYGSVEDRRDFARAKFEGDVKEGLMAKMSPGEFLERYGEHTAIAALAVIVEDEALDKKRIIHNATHGVRVITTGSNVVSGTYKLGLRKLARTGKTEAQGLGRLSGFFWVRYTPGNKAGRLTLPTMIRVLCGWLADRLEGGGRLQKFETLLEDAAPLRGPPLGFREDAQKTSRVAIRGYTDNQSNEALLRKAMTTKLPSTLTLMELAEEL